MNTVQPQLVRPSWSLILGLMFFEAVALAVLAGGATLVWGLSQQPKRDTASAAIRAEMDRQVAAWNKGDLEGFMAGYWNDNKLTFYSGGDITLGWQPTLERYRKRYQGEGKAMGKLVFTDVDVQVLSDDAALARGRWKLTMPDNKTPEGLFTLVLKRSEGQWRITHDHTSAKSP